MFVSASSWEAVLMLPAAAGSGASQDIGMGARAWFGVEGVKPLRGLGAGLAVAYRWLGDGPGAVLPMAGVAAGFSYRIPLAGAFSLRPELEAGAVFSTASGNGTWSLDLAAGLGIMAHLGERNYLSLAPRLHWTPALSQPLSFGFSLGTRTDALWLAPIAEAKPRIELVPSLYSPDGDGIDDAFEVRFRYGNSRQVLAWTLAVLDASGANFVSRQGQGQPPREFSWNGFSDDGKLVDPASDYSVTVSTLDVLGRTAEATRKFTVDILVIKVGDRYKVRIPPIQFPSNSAELAAPGTDSIIEANAVVLGRLIVLFSRFPGYSIIVEGHANSVRWNDPVAFAVEQQDELAPLSLSRASAVRAALAAMGIAPERIQARGLGGLEPLVPFSDTVSAWKNRRVEFMLVRTD
jgi:outer membrane protein OmpA-like peptidoglycan-associated protein